MKFLLSDILKKRNLRMKNHAIKYVYAEYWKVIIRLVIFKNTNLVSGYYKNCCYFNIDHESFIKLLDHQGIKYDDFNHWGITKKNIINILCIYFPIFIRLFFNHYKEVNISTDLQVHNYNFVKKMQSTSVIKCIQHGYFPASHLGDIDGLNSHIYIVRSQSQANLISSVGYDGKFEFLEKKEPKIFESKKIDKIIFLGPGFGHNDIYEETLFKIIKDFDSNVKLAMSYRPHRRCSSNLLNKLKNINIEIDSSDSTIINSSKRRIFVGVKSTMLIDAQEFGHISVLIRSSALPEYFPKGEILNEATEKTINRFFELNIVSS